MLAQTTQKDHEDKQAQKLNKYTMEVAGSKHVSKHPRFREHLQKINIENIFFKNN